jgi:hypothetical protein
MVANWTPAEINRRNAEFWAKQSLLTLERLRYPFLRSIADKIRRTAANLPLRDQPTLDLALELASEKAQDATPSVFRSILREHGRRVLERKGRRGGLKERKDALQKRVIEIVKEKPSISTPQLLQRLRAESPGPVIYDITATQIVFAAEKNVKTADGKLIKVTDKNSSKETSISALKDRLSRARESLRSR